MGFSFPTRLSSVFVREAGKLGVIREQGRMTYGWLRTFPDELVALDRVG